MQRIPGADNKTYTVPSWTSFKRFTRRATIAYCVLAISCAVGVYTYGQKNQNDTLNKINQFALASCMASIRPGSTQHKYNNLVQGIITSRVEALDKAIEEGDAVAVKSHQRAIARYRKDFLDIPTKEQCRVPILKG